MPQIGNTQPVTYIPGQQQTQGIVTNPNPTIPQTTAASNTSGGYPYGEDVFTGQFQMFKNIYSNFDSNISQYSPFYGKMGSASTTVPMGQQTNFNPQSQPTNIPGGNQSIPGGNGNMPPIPQSALQVPPGLANANGNQNVPQNIPPTNTGTMPQTTPQVNTAPKKNPPSGPVINNIQQLLQQEAQQITTPQKAVESIASHAMLSRQERTMANDIAWGAKYYASKAAEAAESLSKNKKSMNPGQVQAQLRTIENLKLKSISLLNDAKKRSINNYNEALKATMLYNNFFTESGQFTTMLNPNDRQFLESELDKTWATWQGGFDKNGQHADESPTVIDKAAAEVAAAIDKADKLSGVQTQPAQ